MSHCSSRVLTPNTLKEEKLKTALQNKDQAQVAEMAQGYLDKMKNVSLNIAITGESGSGKSTLVNALRNIENDTEGASPTGAVETTMVATEYPYPEHPNIRIWDLPGIGTVKFRANRYSRKMQFKKYDFFMIVSSERFTENDAKLAKKIHKMKKNDILKSIRDNCTEGKVFLNLTKLGVESPKVFLVSGLKLHLYDFEDLRKTLMEDLPEHQRDVLQVALPNTSLDAIEQKKKTFEKKIIWLSLTSAAAAAVPVPGVSEGVDLGIIIGFTAHYSVSLGLTPKLLHKLSDLSEVPLDNLKAEIKSPLAGVEITKDLVVKVLTRSAGLITSIVAEETAILKLVYEVPTFVDYKWHLFKPLQEYHRPHELMSNTWWSFVTTYPTTGVGCNTCWGKL
uniref:IRG-type G domain-containing protein n=1 Tax=Neogobius melanostomus TaxID=47308 RepID=A0A8C6UGC5_9GOBI